MSETQLYYSLLSSVVMVTPTQVFPNSNGRKHRSVRLLPLAHRLSTIFSQWSVRNDKNSFLQLDRDGWFITLQYLLVFLCLFWKLCKLFTILMHNTNSSFRRDVNNPSISNYHKKREIIIYRHRKFSVDRV